MSDYSQINDYSAKDALATGNPLKIIKGSDIDAELDAISVAIATKFDSTSIASAGEAQAGISNTVVMTPGRVTSWAQNDAGVIEDLQGLTAPGADRILFWDHSALDTTFLTVGGGLEISGTTLQAVGGVTLPVDETRILTAGNGLSGGGDLSADRSFALDFNEPAAAAIAAGDELAFGDISDTNTVKKITFANFEAALNFTALGGATTITAGAGLSYSVGGTDISADSTIDLDLNELTEETNVDFAADYMPFRDTSAAADRKITPDDLFGAALGDARFVLASTQAIPSATLTKVAFATATYDSLLRGSWASNRYTRGGVAGRVAISANITVAAMDDDDTVDLYIYKDGAQYSRHRFYSDHDDDTPIMSINISDTVSLGATGYVEVWTYVTSAGGETLNDGIQSWCNIIELS